MLIISYKMLVQSLDEDRLVSLDLIVCDEVHRLKNSQIKTCSTIFSLPCPRRVLSVTPVKNDLGEFNSLASGAAPGERSFGFKFPLSPFLVIFESLVSPI